MSNIGYATLSVIPSAKGFGAALTKGVAPELAAAGASSGTSFSKGMLKASAGIAAVFVGVGIASLKMGANFQEATTQLVTGAGESEKSIGLVRQGLLDMAPAVGMGPTALAKAMFLVESAGFHGAAGLLVMKAAAEGAKIGGADATVVANGLTTALTDYHLPASMAATVTSQLTATVAAGKTNMQGLTGSLSAVLPAAAAAHIGLSQILGAMATMTGQGISADQAAQNLANTIRSLQNPSQVASKTMAAMGLNSTVVAQQLGKKGLTGTLAELTGAITKHMGPAGLVLQSAFNTSKLAAQSANVELKNLPSSLQKLAQGFLNGTVTQKEWSKALKGQPALTANLGKQFATTAKQAHGFNDSLKSGSGAGKTYSAILADMLGGATGLNTGLALTGANMGTFTKNVTDISKAAAEAGGHVKGWEETQKDFNVQMDQVSGGVSKMGVKIGMVLIPAVLSAVKEGIKWTDWLTKHQAVTWTIVGALGAFAAIAVAVKAASLAAATAQGVSTAATGLGTAALWLWNTAAIASRAETVALWAMYAADAIRGAVQTELSVGRIVVAYAAQKASAIASAVTSAAAWVVQGARTIVIISEIIVSLVAQKVAMLASRATMIAVAVGTGIWTAAQWLLNAAMTANPIGIVIVAIGALVAGIIWVATKTTWFQTAWEYTWHAVEKITGFVVNVVVSGFRMMLGVWTTVIGGILSAAASIAEKLHLPFATAMRKASDSFNLLSSAADTKLAGVAASASRWGDQTGANFAAGIGGQAYSAAQAAANMGAMVAQGFASGIAAHTALAAMAAGSMAAQAQAAMAANLKAHSPSKATEEIGRWVGQGFVIGMDSQRRSVAASASALISLPRPGSTDFTPHKASPVGGSGNGADVVGAIQALGERFAAELDRQARTIQTLQRQMVGVQ